MISVMLDNDIAGHRDLFDGTLHSTGWDEYRLVKFITMQEAGIAGDAADSEVWRFCQQRGLILLTANRNLDDESSLEQTLREETTHLNPCRSSRSALRNVSSSRITVNAACMA